ncbi:hypothetical protein LJB42_000623 [Komagataella kurtzmanii]|nr:hypothetical protein LJB42_000623 [Komagataella kurtzmanii]
MAKDKKDEKPDKEGVKVQKQLSSSEEDDSVKRADVKKEKKEKKEKKRSRESKEVEELEINLDDAAPLSKKQKRMAKKEKSLEGKPKKESDKPASKSVNGVWIGNLTFDTTRDELRSFLIANTEHLDMKITPENITRINLPKKGPKIRGFAYVDFDKPELVPVCISLSEQSLNGRNLLIKDANSFEGRPEKSKQQQTGGDTGKNKNPPSRILFVGNLSFDTTKEDLEEHFQHCGNIVKIRMATFEDSGKCKGFAFIDFLDVEGATNALNDKLCKRMVGRPLRMEYGEDRSKRSPAFRKPVEEGEIDDSGNVIDSAIEKPKKKTFSDFDDPEEQNLQRSAPQKSFASKPRFNTNEPQGRVKSSVVLANAPRQSAAIVPSQGKKVKFD